MLKFQFNFANITWNIRSCQTKCCIEHQIKTGQILHETPDRVRQNLTFHTDHAKSNVTFNIDHARPKVISTPDHASISVHLTRGRPEVLISLLTSPWSLLKESLCYFIATRKYSPLRGLSSSSCRGLWPRLFFLPCGQFLAALSSSRSLVVCPSVRPSVGRSVRPLTLWKSDL